MAIVTETITITTTGANAGTQNYSVQVNTATGAGVNPLSVPIIGTAAGTSTVTATMPSHAGVPASNQAEITWQATNGLIAVTPYTITAYSNTGLVRGWPTLNGSVLGVTANANSLVLNQVVQSYPISGYPSQPGGNGGGYKLNPMTVVQQTSTGTYSSALTIAGTSTNESSGNYPGFVLSAVTNLVVATAGTYTLYVNYANVSSFAVYIGGGATFSSASAGSGGGNNTGNGAVLFPTTGPKSGTPIAIVSTNVNAGAHPAIISTYVTFPTPGVYPLEYVYNQFLSCQPSYDNNSFFQITYLSGAQNQSVGSQGPGTGPQSFPVALAVAPPAGATPTGDLRLTPTGGTAGLKVQGQTDTLTLTIQNVSYPSIPYVPILEGTPGALFVYNSGTAFNFQTYNGFAVDTTSAAANVFSITGTNTNGIFDVTPQSNHFLLNYNGGAFSFITPTSQVSSTDLTLTADDIAWYDGTAGPDNKEFDLFSPVGGAGGIAYSIDVDFMVKPTVLSVSPTSLQANGTTQAFTINLSQAMSPEQQGLYGTGNTVVPSASLSGGALFRSPLTPVLNNGFLTGYSTNVLVPISSTNGSINLTFNLSGTLTYLSGTTFVTGTVNYIVNSVTAIPTVGDQYVAPVAVSVATSPGGTPLSTNQTISGTVYTFDNNTQTMQFYQKGVTSGVATLLGTGVLTNSYTGTVGGKTAYYKVYSLSHAFSTVSVATSTAAEIYLGFVDTDTVSGLNVTYYSTTVYTQPYTIVGGGGGGGCPAVEMYLDEWHQVFDVFEGMGVETLAGETTDYVGGVAPKTETRQVEWFDFDTQVCYRLKAANGCEVIVSGSTPVPTLEAIEAHARGEQIEAGYANEVRVGMHVVTEIDLDEAGDRVEWSPLVEAECIGMRRVARVYCGGRNFAAGTKPGRYIYTHNLMPIEPK
jgi:hypothetical protein